MTTIAIYLVQAVLGLTVMIFGASSLLGAEIMVRSFELVGIGGSLRLAIGVAEIAAGLCLLFPRGGIMGSAVLACVMVGTLGVSIGHIASRPIGAAGIGAPKAAAVSLYLGDRRPAAIWSAPAQGEGGIDI
ncbi:MAG: hypothetical protein HXY30_14530 [Pseudorhodoplanes sp.]|nr:hypothetical protein [Pseudorhodoplanes sp.]